MRKTLHQTVKEAILSALIANKWERNKAAEQLGIDRKTIYKHIARHWPHMVGVNHWNIHTVRPPKSPEPIPWHGYCPDCATKPCVC